MRRQFHATVRPGNERGNLPARPSLPPNHCGKSASPCTALTQGEESSALLEDCRRGGGKGYAGVAHCIEGMGKIGARAQTVSYASDVAYHPTLRPAQRGHPRVGPEACEIEEAPPSLELHEKNRRRHHQ